MAWVFLGLNCCHCIEISLKKLSQELLDQVTTSLVTPLTVTREGRGEFIFEERCTKVRVGV